MNRVCLVTLIGLPALGKTTLCKYLMENDTLPFNIFHLCYDNIIEFNSGNPSEYREQREYLLKYLNEIVKSFKSCGNLEMETSKVDKKYRNNNSKDLIILCDDNHYYRSMRYKLFQIAREYNISYCQIYFEYSLDLVLERNNTRRGMEHIPEEVILKMYERLEPPNALEYKWEENTIILKKIDSKENLSLEVVFYLMNILKTSVQPLILKKSKNLTPQSLVHELDLVIRKRIRAIMESSAKINNKKLLAKQLNDKRKQILNEFSLEINHKVDDNIDLNIYVDLVN